ncbi:hypothetical protein ACO1O0_005458 [Amphichorda felina]
MAAEEPCTRSFFYAGGRYVDGGDGRHMFCDQMYVERLRPVGGATQDAPVVMIHGQAQTGTNFLNKPDGGRGWASEFLSQGYEVYLVDQALRGRSPVSASPRLAQPLPPAAVPAEFIQQRFTAPRHYKLWPQASKHTQWPGTGLMGDPVFDAFYSSNVQFERDCTYQQTAVQRAGAALLDLIGRPAILIGHSQGGTMPLLLADARPHLAKALVLLEPKGPPFREAVFSAAPSRPWGLTDVPITYSPPVSDPSELVQQTHPARDDDSVECVLQAEDPPPRQLINLVDLPIMVLTGEASYHMPYDYCTVRFLRQAGCHKTSHVQLGDIGIHGNGHMMFMEKNSHEVQKVVHDWIQGLG